MSRCAFPIYLPLYFISISASFTYDHRILNPALPVRSAVLKQDTGGLVVRWVTTGEYPLLYVFAFFDAFSYTNLVVESFVLYLKTKLGRGRGAA